MRFPSPSPSPASFFSFAQAKCFDQQPRFIQAVFPSLLQAAAIVIHRRWEGERRKGPGQADARTLEDLRGRMTALLTGHTPAMRRAIDAAAFANIAMLEAVMRV